jgi:DHA3 family macrolide efflux protein-like MFS transporter
MLRADLKRDEKAGWKRPFFAIWTGQALSLSGSRIVQFALIWWLTKQSGSALVLATASMAGLLPMLALSPVIGVYVDRWDRRLTMLFSDSLIALVTIFLSVLFAFGKVGPNTLYLFLAIRAILGCFHSTAMRASTPLLVPNEHLTRVQSLNVTLQGGLNIVAAPIGALLLSLMPIKSLVLIDAATAVPAICTLLLYTIPQPDSDGGIKKSVFEDLAAGLEYLKSWPGLLLLILLMSLLNLLLVPLQTLLPLLVTQHFHGEAKHLAFLESSLGIGIVFGGAALSLRRGVKNRIITMLIGFVGFGSGALAAAFASERFFPVALLGLFIIGCSNACTNAPFTAIIQSVVKPRMQGRIFSLIMTLAMGAGPIGLIIAGPIAEMYDARTMFLISGSICVILGLGAFFVPSLRGIESGSGSGSGSN